LIRTGKLEARQFFLFHFKGTPPEDQQKTFRRRLITFKVTLTDQSHFMLIFLLYTVHCTVYSRINSVKSLYAITSTPYYECTAFVRGHTNSVKSLSFS
jgi:hypothetical protein